MDDKRGEQIMIIGDHPHKGQTGIYQESQPTIVGIATLIQLDDGRSCYVYKTENIKWLED